jgi:FAD-linked sulfhydryl oxidase
MFNWGRPGWKFLHAVTFAYPKNPDLKTKLRYRRFFKMLKYVLPCPLCRAHYAKLVQHLGIKHMKNTGTLSRWLVDVHNKINVKLGKKVFSYEEVKQMYR